MLDVPPPLLVSALSTEALRSQFHPSLTLPRHAPAALALTRTYAEGEVVRIVFHAHWSRPKETRASSHQ